MIEEEESRAVIRLKILIVINCAIKIFAQEQETSLWHRITV